MAEYIPDEPVEPPVGIAPAITFVIESQVTEGDAQKENQE